MTENKAASKLQFIFQEQGFVPDNTGIVPEELSQRDRELLALCRENRYRMLYEMGFMERQKEMTVSVAYLHSVAAAFFECLTSLPELELVREHAVVKPTDELLGRLLLKVPFAIGSEHITKEWLLPIFAAMERIFAEEMAEYSGSVHSYLTERNHDLRVPERIFFHLVENRDDAHPFAFMATYATRMENGRVSHMPLQYALTEYKDNRDKLISLLSCLNGAAEVSPLISEFMEKGELFHPLKLTSQEAYTFLKDVEGIEKTGILCRIPNWWKSRASSIQMTVKLGNEKPSVLGFEALISMKPELAVDGIPLNKADIKNLLSQTEGLALLKGKWVEVDHGRLRALLDEMEDFSGEIKLLDALKMSSGMKTPDVDGGVFITNGKWLASMLQNMRRPDAIKDIKPPATFHATLRPYQSRGMAWLNYMGKLHFGACLADDMGLGKTVQILAYLEKERSAGRKRRVLLIVPASLLGNWEKEIVKFAPAMGYHILHGKSSSILAKEVMQEQEFLTITTYGMASRIKELQRETWDCLILDEAQAIKNPIAAQTREIKKIPARMRIAMTGTPIENDLTNLWSLFDFLNKGLMGTSAEFKRYCKTLDDEPEGYARLRSLVSPFMIRRIKTDKTIIDDLPEKLETVDYAGLSKKQIVLYRKVVDDMEEKLSKAETGMERRGLVLATIMRLKQICNHPDQYLGQQAFAAGDSGKLMLLKELCETIYEKRERVLVFTQFREITEHLATFLTGIFHAKGHVLHGGTPVKTRNMIVDDFQGEDYVPFIVLSVKAGGTGLNLTKANHVIHFDRWWNPAVENQATDRAFRIGQTKNVMVHKLVSEGTIEEKIDLIINTKKELSENVIGSGGEKWITEMSDAELMSIMRLE